MATSLSGDHLESYGLVCDVIPRDDVTVVRIEGEVDMTTAPVLETALERATREGLQIVVDCARLTDIDSTGVDLMIRYRPRARRIVLAGASRLVQTIVEVLGLRTMFPLYDSLDAAIAAWSPPPRFPSRMAWNNRS